MKIMDDLNPAMIQYILPSVQNNISPLNWSLLGFVSFKEFHLHIVLLYSFPVRLSGQNWVTAVHEWHVSDMVLRPSWRVGLMGKVHLLANCLGIWSNNKTKKYLLINYIFASKYYAKQLRRKTAYYTLVYLNAP